MITSLKQNIWQLHFEEFGSCVYVLKLRGKIILIDTSSKECRGELLEDLDELKIKPLDINYIIITHSHWDHIGNNDLFTKAKFFDAEKTDELEKTFPEFEIIKTPGHTKDCLCILYDEVLFSGDTIFHNNGVGRTDLPGGSQKELEKSIAKLQKLKYKFLAPGHI